MSDSLDGILNLIKPPGMTSHDVVDYVRKMFKIKRAGHTGTLDPGAVGVLPVCVGRATRASEYLLGSDKVYRAVMILGMTTDTYDTQGKIESETDASNVSLAMVENALEGFRGLILQAPPMVSAAKHKGQRLYELARKGIEVERETRPVTVYSIDIVDWQPGRQARVIVDITCSKGTYVRSICHDVGQVLGCGAYLHFLVRVKHGPFSIGEGVTLEELTAAEGGLRYLIPLESALSFMPRVTLKGEEVKRVFNGARPGPRPVTDIAGLNGAPVASRRVRLLDPEGRLVAVARVETQGGSQVVGLRPERVFGGNAGG